MSYKKRGIDHKGFVSCPKLSRLGYLREFCLIYTISIRMSKRATPSDSSNPEFIFQARMTAMNPNESLPVIASREVGSDKVLELTPKMDEVVSMPAKQKGKGKVTGTEIGNVKEEK